MSQKVGNNKVSVDYKQPAERRKALGSRISNVTPTSDALCSSSHNGVSPFTPPGQTTGRIGTGLAGLDVLLHELEQRIERRMDLKIQQMQVAYQSEFAEFRQSFDSSGIVKENHEMMEMLVDSMKPIDANARPAMEKLQENGTDDHEENEPSCTPYRLDQGGMWQFQESLWDVCAFVGHECLGSVVSAVIAVSCFLNLLIQIIFCLIVDGYMLSPALESENLKQLLRWRLGVAHNIKYADPVTDRSMASLVCEGSSKLHMSADQKTLVDTLRDYIEGGEALCNLAEFLWIATIFRELSSIVEFVRAIWTMKRGPDTKVTINQSDGQENGGEVGNLYSLLVTTRLVAISSKRVWSLTLGVALPRALVAVYLGTLGVFYLSQSNRMEDLVLNAMALAFVIEIDEILYPLCAPRRAKTLMANMEPVPVPSRAILGRAWSGLHVVGRVAAVIVLLISIQQGVVKPTFQTLLQAERIMCSGNLDFTYAVNPLTSFTHVGKTPTDAEWTFSELLVMQTANPDLTVDPKYQEDADIRNAVDLRERYNDVMLAIVEPANPSGSRGSIEDAPYLRPVQSFLRMLGGADPADAAKYLACMDLSSGQSERAITMLLAMYTGQWLPNNGTITCDEIPVYLCFNLQGTFMRALCPRRCGCHFPVTYAGIFSTAYFGCPDACITERLSWEENTMPISRQCSDVPVEWLSGPVFNGSGLWLHEPYGAVKMQLDEMNDDPAVWMPWWFSQFADSFWTYLPTRYGFAKNAMDSMPQLVVWGVIPAERLEEMQHHVQTVSNTWAELWHGRDAWDLLPGLPHSRGLTGCEFLSSWEFKWLYTIDLCAAGDEWTSIRYVCPSSCRCGIGEPECPRACGVQQQQQQTNISG